jgi:hypothetical protein
MILAFNFHYPPVDGGTGHNAPLAAIDIDDLMGDIATCSSTGLHQRQTVAGQRKHPGGPLAAYN